MKREMPLTMPPKTSHQFMALPLSIIMNDENMWGWYYSEFIQMFTHRDEGDNDNNIFLRYYNYDMIENYEPLECVRISPYTIKIGSGIIELFKGFIEDGYYIYVLCDDSYISTMNIQNHRYHDILIHGYDDDEKSFKVFSYNGIKLTKFNVLYDDFISAYNSDFIKDNFRLTILYKPKKIKYDLDMKKIKWRLLDYLECIDTLKREMPSVPTVYKVKWGMDIYEDLVERYENHKQKDSYLSFAEIYNLYEHKKDMVGRVEFLNENSSIRCTDEILGKLIAVENEALKTVNQIIKINQKGVKNSISDLERLISRIKNIKELEFAALNEYYIYNKSSFDEI